MTRKTNNKWSTDNCVSCGRPHNNYTGKLDKYGDEYIICEYTHDRINMSFSHNSGNTFKFFSNPRIRDDWSCVVKSET